MGKKRRFLGFLSFFVIAFTACLSYADIVQCTPGKAYWNGTEIDCLGKYYCDSNEKEELNAQGRACMKACSSLPGGVVYNKSEPGSSSENACYRDVWCEEGVCPSDVKSCVWDHVSLGREYYGSPMEDTTCPIKSITCDETFYITDALRCASCSAIPGYENKYPNAAGVAIDRAPTGPGQCFAVCTPKCTHDECPVNATCTYTDVAAGWGGVFYPTEIIPDNCEALIPVSCQMTVSCDKKEGYGVFFPGGSGENMRCDPNPLTINYDPNGGTGEIAPTVCLYDAPCSASAQGEITRQNWEFRGWNTAADGSGQAYAVGADITNIISDGAITLYAQWNRLSAKCEEGKFYDGNNQVPCPVGSFCPGIGEAPAGEEGCSQPCPNGGLTELGATAQSQCYIECPGPGEIKNGTLSNVHEIENNDGVSETYPVCTYHATCDTNYVAKNNDSTSPKCVWENPDNCPVGFYCPDGSDEPIACPRIKDDDSAPRGTSDIGTRLETDCYYIFAPWENFRNGNASGKCKYTDDVARYSACNLERAFSCLPGYYHLTEQTVGCTGVQQGYYSDGTNAECLADNYTSQECVASLSQKACPEKDTNPTVASAEYATSITQCSKECVKTDSHGTVSRTRERVNATNAGVYEACEFTVTCDTGYEPAENGTENAHCVARKYEITLDKNGGAGDTPDKIECTFDSGVCDLPSSAGLSRTGYSLVPRWCTNATGDGTCYTAGTRVTTNISSDGGNITLYAVWTPKVYKITLNSNAATVAPVPENVYLKYGIGWFKDSNAQNPIQRLTTLPTKTGYNFSGFYNSENTVRIISDSGEFLTSVHALTFTAQEDSIFALWAAGLTECQPGTYYKGTGSVCETCSENHYCIGGNFATDAGVAGQDECPDNGVSETGAESVKACYKTGQPYTASHGAGTQTCHYDANAQTYTIECDGQDISSCNAGYWLDTTITSIDCSPVGRNYYSVGGGVNRNSCPMEDSMTGKTDKDNATSESECFMKNRVYDLNNGGVLYGHGTQTCYYNTGATKYNDRCIRDTISITYCNGGYWFDTTQNKYDCVEVGENYYSEPGEIIRSQCPAPRGAESGTPNTRGNTTTDSATGCFMTRELTTALHGRGHWGCFYNDDAAVKDYTNCSNPEMYECDAGYYYKSSISANDCIAVGRNNYSPARDTALHICPNDGFTLSDTAGAATDCLKENIVCNVPNGVGLQTCAFNGVDGYSLCNCSNGCTTCSITGCDTGYSLVGNMCIMCPANNVCSGGTQKTCSTLTDGQYPNSDAGTLNVSGCWRECRMGVNATAMSGRDYQNGDSTCAIAKCRQGYSLQNGVCVACPAGRYCDGTDSDINGKSCTSLGDGSWNLSAPGASSASECYKECLQYDVDNGIAIPLQERAYWDNHCEYRGKSLLGNDCEIVDGVCIETSCINIYEMVNGRCKPCNREHALSYAPDGNCIIASCMIGYHVENGRCVADTRECSAPHATAAHQSWDFKMGAYSTCIIDQCADGYHVASNACVLDIQSCDIENGIGTMEWNHSTRAWGNCVAKSCNAGYTNDPTLTNERWKQCGECKNKYSVHGERAVSTYIRECEVASCLYQGEMYNLENDECVPICDVNGYEDETGTMKWNPTTHKCERKCKSGYIMWN